MCVFILLCTNVNINCIGKPVLVVNGAYRGTKAILEALDTAKFCVSVRINQVYYSLIVYLHGYILCIMHTVTFIYFIDQCRDQHMEEYWREFHMKIYVNCILNHDNTYIAMIDCIYSCMAVIGWLG